MARRNETTADVYFRRLARVLHDVKGMTPVQVLDLSQDQLDDLAMDCIEHELDRGRLGGTVEGFRKSLVSFLAWNRRELKRPLHVPGAHDAPHAGNAKIPEPEDLARVLAASNTRTAAIAVLLAHAGLRPQILGKIDASDGLTIQDIPDLSVTGGGVVFENVPALVRVRRALSKTNKPFLTFLGPEACRHLKVYLQWRIKRGEKLTPKSPVIATYGGEPRFATRNKISDTVRRAMRTAGLEEPPYIWRSYFSNRCLMAEAKGLPASYRKFFMGHKGGMQARYGLHKQLPQDVIQEMRQAYGKGLRFLETASPVQEDQVPEFLDTFLQVTGYTAQDVQAMDLASKTKEERVKILQEALAARGHTRSRPVKQRLVAITEMEALLAEGWAFKAVLPDDRVIVEQA